jgi:hypothetical protein
MSMSSKAFLVAALALSLAACGRMDQTAEDATNDNAPEAVKVEAPRVETRRAEPVVQMVTVPAGTSFGIKMKNTLDSGENQRGDQFRAKVTEDVRMNGRVVIPAGSVIRGEVKDVQAAKRGAGQASMTLDFNVLMLPDNSSKAISASLTQQSESQKKHNAAIIGGSAAGGALLGKLIGKDTKAAVAGAVVGGAIGTGVVMGQDKGQVKIPKGTELMIQLDQDIRIAPQS